MKTVKRVRNRGGSVLRCVLAFALAFAMMGVAAPGALADEGTAREQNAAQEQPGAALEAPIGAAVASANGAAVASGMQKGLPAGSEASAARTAGMAEGDAPIGDAAKADALGAGDVQAGSVVAAGGTAVSSEGDNRGEASVERGLAPSLLPMRGAVDLPLAVVAEEGVVDAGDVAVATDEAPAADGSDALAAQYALGAGVQTMAPPNTARNQYVLYNACLGRSGHRSFVIQPLVNGVATRDGSWQTYFRADGSSRFAINLWPANGAEKRFGDIGVSETLTLDGGLPLCKGGVSGNQLRDGAACP